MELALPVIAAALGALVIAVVAFRLTWRVAEPNEALVISGLREHRASDAVDESLGFRIITGRGTLVVPGVQTVRRLSLDLREAELQIDCVTHQGIPLGVRGVVIFKVGDDFASIANAARRFLDQQDKMDHRVHNVFAGHLRAIVGNMTVEEMIRDREKLTQLTRASSGTEMEKLGLIVDSLQIQEIVDPTGYIKNLGRPHAAAVERDARIAQASSDRAATQAEQEADALKAEARRTSEIKQAGFQAEIDAAAVLARQAGPLTSAQERQEVVVQETRVAQLEAEREEQTLQVSVRKPADAKAYQEVTLARAERDARIAAAEAQAREVQLRATAEAERTRMAAGAEAERTRVEAEARAAATRALGQAEATATQAKGLAEGEAVRARGLAEAESIKARADALAENTDAVIGHKLATRWPDVVRAAAEPFAAIDQLVVLNGAEGLSQTLAQTVSQGMAGLSMARRVLSGAADGADRSAAPAPAPAHAGNGSTPA